MDSLTSIPLPLVLFVLYAAGGLTVATVLHRGGHPSATTVSALVAWPVLIPLPTRAPTLGPALTGPLAAKITSCLAALRRSLDDPATAGLASGHELAGLERSLLTADTRLGVVDRILAEADTTDEAVARSADRLRQARSRSAAEIEAVISELEQLRLHAALMVLSGESAAIRERVASLLHRASAIEEVAAVHLLQA